tara:strand:+ start:669 stop:1856 length:1188 start_codon:yes stop_codon:yes gene_type:complete
MKINESHIRKIVRKALLEAPAPAGINTPDQATARQQQSDNAVDDKQNAMGTAALANLATNLLKDKEYTGGDGSLATFLDIINGAKVKTPRVAAAFMRNDTIRKAYEEYNEASAVPKKKSSGQASKNQKPTKKGNTSSSAKDKVKKIQAIIGTDVDGSWGPKTTTAWKAWIVSASVKTELKNLKVPEEFLESNKGKAAVIAKKAGYVANLNGVLELAKLIDSRITKTDNPEAESENPEAEKTTTSAASWKTVRNESNFKATVNELNKAHPALYDRVIGNTQADIAIGKALFDKDSPGVHVVFVRSMAEFKKFHPGKTFKSFVQVNVGYEYTTGGTLKAKGDEAFMSAKTAFKSSNIPGVIFFDEAKSEILIDTFGGDHIIKNVKLTNDKSYIKVSK